MFPGLDGIVLQGDIGPAEIIFPPVKKADGVTLLEVYKILRAYSQFYLPIRESKTRTHKFKWEGKDLKGI